MTRPFRFLAPMPRLSGSADEWRDEVRRIEDLGYDAVTVSEHLTGGWTLDAVGAMAAIAVATSRLRVMSLVLASGLRHPVQLHRAAATIDKLSDGRLDLGLGAGWLAEDYRAVDVPFEPASARIARLDEAVTIIKGLFASPTFEFSGRYYQVAADGGLPRPVQQPHPPILIGGGGPRILEVAARHADIIGIHARMPSQGGVSAAAARDLDEPMIAERVARTREAVRAAGRDPDDLDYQFTVYACRITDVRSGAPEDQSAFARFLLADPTLAARSPAVLAGSRAAVVERLLELRERYGFNVIKLSGSPGDNAPLVRELSGR